MSRYKFYNVEIDGVTYKVQAFDSEDARESAMEIDIGSRVERKYVRDTVKDEDSVRVWRED